MSMGQRKAALRSTSEHAVHAARCGEPRENGVLWFLLTLACVFPIIPWLIDYSSRRPGEKWDAALKRLDDKSTI